MPVIPSAAEKISALKKEIDRLGLDTKIEVDGGVNAENAAMLREMGADILVAGSFVFNSDDRRDAIEKLK